MHETAELLGAWGSYYVMLGSSAGALTGLVFVVITLVRDRETAASQAGIATFTTPTIVHFCSALFTAGVMSAPFRSLVPVAILVGLAGLNGAVYVVRIALRSARLDNYRPDAEDWTWNVALPLLAYGALVAAAIALRATPGLALYVPAAAVMLLILIGIHNAWDVVTFLATGKAEALADTPGGAVPPKPDTGKQEP